MSLAQSIAEEVVKSLASQSKKQKDYIPNVEAIQDEVERQLMLHGYTQSAKAYILYREERAKKRSEVRESELSIPKEVRDKVRGSEKFFNSSYQQFIFYQFYARWQDELGRRETWIESIDRYMDYMQGKLNSKFTQQEYAELREAILKQEICPSMRLLWSAGEACDATNVTAYNCAYIAPASWQDLSEIMYVSMCGAGCGFAVEPENVEQFPIIKKQTGKSAETIVVGDSKEGWCESFVQACNAWSNGLEVHIDYSRVRPAGSRLMTMGGRSSGPAPLRDLMEFTKKKMLSKQGGRLSYLLLFCSF